MSSTNVTHAVALEDLAGRLGGCLWLVVAGMALLFVAGAAGVGIDASLVLVALVMIPLAIAVAMFIVGNRVVVQILSAAAAAAYAGLGLWNYLRAEDFERANPGSVDISGGISLTFVLLALAICAWSLGTVGLIRRGKSQ